MIEVVPIIPSEHAEQVTFVREFERRYPEVRIFAIPNGGYRHKRTADNLKAEGVKKGVPDLFIPAWNLWIEMKRVKGSQTSKEQKDWIEYLNSIGHTAVICKGYEEALKACEEYKPK